jgi:hypothetical protein
VSYKHTTCFGLRPSSSILIQKYPYRSFATRVSQLKIWHFWVIGIERKGLQCTFNRYSVITNLKNSPLEISCVVALIENYSTKKTFKSFSWKSHKFWIVTLLSKMSDMRKISGKYGSRKGASFFNYRHVQKLNTIIGYVFKTQNFVKNYCFHFLEDNGCVERGKICFLLHNLEVECLLFFLMVFFCCGLGL